MYKNYKSHPWLATATSQRSHGGNQYFVSGDIYMDLIIVNRKVAGN